MAPRFQETNLLSAPIRDLGLTIAGTPLEPVILEFLQEIERVGIRRLKPHFYLSTEWGVPFGTVSIAIPFYLAHRDLIAFHAERAGHLEGVGRGDLLRYLRHEMGHVVNYAYQLFEREEWVEHFGSITQPYVEEYRPAPFSTAHVRHLPGWYAQKHPDEDWAETFAVWMTPGLDWRKVYAGFPEAIQKLEYCARVMPSINQQEPRTTATELDEDVSEIASTVEDWYETYDAGRRDPMPPGLDGALTAIFDDFRESGDEALLAQQRPADELILALELELVANVYRWTGHFPEPTRRLIHHLAHRARELRQVYPTSREREVTIALTTLVTSLAMTHVTRGKYTP